MLILSQSNSLAKEGSDLWIVLEANCPIKFMWYEITHQRLRGYVALTIA